MISLLFRGKGNLVPLIGVGSLLVMMFAQPGTLRICQSIVVALLAIGGVWIAWYGARSLQLAQRELGRPLHWYEWVFDVVLWKPLPFHSFMLIQMPWWALAYAASVAAMVTKIMS